MVIGKSYQAGDHAARRGARYWTRGRQRSHYLSGAVSMTADGMNRDRLQAMGTCVQVAANYEGGQRGPWGMQFKSRTEAWPWVDPAGVWAKRPRGKRRGKGRTLRPAVVRRAAR